MEISSDLEGRDVLGEDRCSGLSSQVTEVQLLSPEPSSETDS